MATLRRTAVLFLLLAAFALEPARPLSARPIDGGGSGPWTPLANNAPAGINTMLLLTDGTVMAQAAGTTADWYRLSPDAHGDYAQGAWSKLASMNDTRLYYGSA